MNYVNACGPTSARIMLVGEHPGPDEMREGKPFVGTSGWELKKMLNEAGINFHDCFTTNVIRFMPSCDTSNLVIKTAKDGQKSGHPQYRGRWCHPTVIEHVSHLKREIELVQPNVIIALGNLALWALNGADGITSWRGYIEAATLAQRVDGKPFKFIPTFHPAGVQRNWPWRWDTVQDLRLAKRESETPVLFEPAYRFTIRPSYWETLKYLSVLLSRLNNTETPIKLSVDIETRRKHIACLGIATSSLEAFCIPFMCVERPAGYWEPHEELEIVWLLEKVLAHPMAWVIGQNFHYDAQYIARRMGFIPRLKFDTMIGHHVCFPDQRKALDYIVPRYCEYPKHWKDDGREWEVRKLPEDRLWSYNCQDCVYTFECAEALDASGGVIDKMGLRPQRDFQMRLFMPVLKMMFRGVRRNEAMRRVLAGELEGALSDRSQYFRDVLGHELNPGSSKQMHTLFYKDFALPPVKNRSSGKDTLNDEALDTICRKEPLLKPVVQGIREYRSCRVFKSTFVDASVDEDGRIRCSYNQTGAKTFRFSSSESVFGTGGNLQNVPSGDAVRIALYCKANGPTSVSKLMDVFAVADKDHGAFMDEVDKAEDNGYITVEERHGASPIVHYRFVLPNVRKLFLPDPDHVLLEFDLKGADFQVVAWEAEDEGLKQALRAGLDIHNQNMKDLRMSSRKVAKAWVHMIDYGASARTAAIKSGFTVHQSETYKKRWYALHPGIERWHRRTEKMLMSQQTTANAFGYRIFWFDRPEGMLPKALAWIPQSTVGIVINMGLVNVDERLPDVQILLQTHDSLTLQCHKDIVRARIPDIQRELAITVPYADPLVIPTSMKWSDESWGDVKEMIA